MTQTVAVPEKNLLRVDEVAKLLDTSERSIRRQIESGELRAVNTSAADQPRWRIYRESLMAFFEERDSFNQVERKFR